MELEQLFQKVIRLLAGKLRDVIRLLLNVVDATLHLDDSPRSAMNVKG